MTVTARASRRPIPAGLASLASPGGVSQTPSSTVAPTRAERSRRERVASMPALELADVVFLLGRRSYPLAHRVLAAIARPEERASRACTHELAEALVRRRPGRKVFGHERVRRWFARVGGSSGDITLRTRLDRVWLPLTGRQLRELLWFALGECLARAARP